MRSLFFVICEDPNDLDEIQNYCNLVEDNCTFCDVNEVRYALSDAISILTTNESEYYVYMDRLSCLTNVSRTSEDECNDDDKDGDFIPDLFDNCPETPNSYQEDWNFNDVGDACDDYDGDGVTDDIDNCITVSNPFQADIDGDGIGDDCDNCNLTEGNSPSDIDADGIEDDCDDDIDGDGIPNDDDNCPEFYNPEQNDEACEKEPCLSDKAIQMINEMESCIDNIHSNLQDRISELAQERQSCKNHFDDLFPEVVNRQILHNAWFFGYVDHFWNCFADFGFELHYDENSPWNWYTDRERKMLLNCVNDGVWEQALSEGYDPDMPSPSQSDTDLYKGLSVPRKIHWCARHTAQ